MEERNLTCIGCPLGCALKVTIDGENVTVTGNTCKRGADYGAKEVTHPTRIVTSTVCVKNGTIPMVSVKTAQDIPRKDNGCDGLYQPDHGRGTGAYR